MGSFVHTLRVRYAEIDGQKVVYNAHYLTYVDLAITEYFRNLGVSFADPEAGFDISLVKATQEFKRPAYLDDLVDVRVSIVRLGNSSFTARFEAVPHGEEDLARAYMEAEVIYVSYSSEKAAAVPIPGWMRERIESFEDADDERRSSDPDAP